jgi:hypothetical protein
VPVNHRGAGTIEAMDGPSSRAGGEQPVERFKPTTGVVVGWVGLVLAVLTMGYALVTWHSVGGVRTALGAAFLAVLVWATQLRPRVTAYRRHLVVHGPVRDTAIPYSRIGEVTMGQTLNIRANGRRYVCVGIGRSVGMDVRQRLRATGGDGLLGLNRVSRVSDLSGQATPSAASQHSMSYPDFVLTRLTDLVAAAPRFDDEVEDVRHAPAVPEVVALAVTGVAFVLSLLLL